MATATEERQALIEEIRIRRAIKDREYGADCKLWAHEQVRTVDEATQKLRHWPDDKPYLDELLDLYESEQLIALPKSRRLLVTWSVALWMTWRCRYYLYNAAYIQSDKEEKSAYVVDQRCKFIEDNLAEDWCKRSYNSIRTKNGMVGRLTYPDMASYIVGVAEGADKIRSYTASIIVLDECEFQEGAHAALTAIMALVEGNKNVTCILISTSNGPQGILAGICKEVGFVKWS
jgi:hypothetical protein